MVWFLLWPEKPGQYFLRLLLLYPLVLRQGLGWSVHGSFRFTMKLKVALICPSSCPKLSGFDLSLPLLPALWWCNVSLHLLHGPGCFQSHGPPARLLNSGIGVSTLGSTSCFCPAGAGLVCTFANLAYFPPYRIVGSTVTFSPTAITFFVTCSYSPFLPSHNPLPLS